MQRLQNLLLSLIGCSTAGAGFCSTFLSHSANALTQKYGIQDSLAEVPSHKQHISSKHHSSEDACSIACYIQ